MNIIDTKERYHQDGYTKAYRLDNTVQIHSLIDFIKQFENDSVKMITCQCYTYDSEGHPAYYSASSLDAIKKIYADADSPCFDYIIDFINEETMSYAFSLVTSINSSYVMYEVNKKNANRVEKRIAMMGKKP